jgi:hypothetical protein
MGRWLGQGRPFGPPSGLVLMRETISAAAIGQGRHVRMKTWPDVHSGENMNTGCFRGSRSTRREYVHLPRR